ncbi:uncharacterized protein LOC118756623 [Rhagoletis pomonella]|uniref:uncharacterized protein LOC118756623 n=1 Tax=Rhagoletis pomonella TaxID=28610 RepID=UPI00177F978E|nr:uncharacterized protein LOC118756623 [Rhagoletis pomonella]
MKECRALCDMGSQVSFISEPMLTLLNLPRNACKLRVEGVDSSLSAHTKGTVPVCMRSLVDESFSLNFSAYILDSITSTTPATSIDVSTWTYVHDLQLADPTLGTPGTVDLLIGADILPTLLLTEIRTGPNNMPCALQTRLGWIVFGPATATSCSSTMHHTLLSSNPVEQECLEQLLRKFWETEEPPAEVTSHVDECEGIFVKTVTRSADGRYCITSW